MTTLTEALELGLFIFSVKLPNIWRRQMSTHYNFSWHFLPWSKMPHWRVIRNKGLFSLQQTSPSDLLSAALWRASSVTEDTHAPTFMKTDSNHWQHTYALQITSTIWFLSVPVFMTVIVLRCNYTLTSLQFLETEGWIHFCMCYFDMFTRNLM